MVSHSDINSTTLIKPKNADDASTSIRNVSKTPKTCRIRSAEAWGDSSAAARQENAGNHKTELVLSYIHLSMVIDWRTARRSASVSALAMEVAGLT
jgi:hypothetical protein